MCSTISNMNMADALTCEVGATLPPLNTEPKIMYDNKYLKKYMQILFGVTSLIA
jgi:hypothetical protein